MPLPAPARCLLGCLPKSPFLESMSSEEMFSTCDSIWSPDTPTTQLASTLLWHEALRSSRDSYCISKYSRRLCVPVFPSSSSCLHSSSHHGISPVEKDVTLLIKIQCTSQHLRKGLPGPVRHGKCALEHKGHGKKTLMFKIRS